MHLFLDFLLIYFREWECDEFMGIGLNRFEAKQLLINWDTTLKKLFYGFVSLKIPY